MARVPLPYLLLAVPLACQVPPAAPPGPAQAPAAARPQVAGPTYPLLAIDFQGGSGDDAQFARAASGLEKGKPVGEAEFRAALEAVRLTDRFRSADGQLLPGPGGARALFRLDPWPALTRLEWVGDARRRAIGKYLRGLRPGMRPGDRRLAAWGGELQGRLAESGYPRARVGLTRSDGDRTLVVDVDLGQPDLVRQVELVGDPAPYTREEILHRSGLQPGRTLWSQTSKLAAIRRLRGLFHGNGRFEALVDVQWESPGTVRLAVTPGPRVILAAAGDRLGWNTSLKDLIPLARADRYDPELLDEGDRLIVRHFRTKGYLDAMVSHRREVTKYRGTPYEEVTVTYTIRAGKRTTLAGVRFEGNSAVSEAELRGATGLHGGLLAPKATPDLLDALEDRVKGVYQSRGFTDTSLRRQLERQDGHTVLVMRIQEGPRRMLQYLRLELPPGGFGDPWRLGECLPLIFANAPVRLAGPEGLRTFASDRPALAGTTGALALAAPQPGAPEVLTFTLSRPIPLLKADLARVFTALKSQRLPALGLVRPVVRLSLEPAADGRTGVRIEVPAQPQERIQRLVVTGSDKTRAEAVLRETRLAPGAPLDTDQLSRAQARLSSLGAFQRVDLRSLSQTDAAGPAGTAPAEPGPAEPGSTPPAPASAAPPWKPGDLHLTVEERPPYVVTSSFGYDKSQGYHVGLGLQQLNVGGMGRSLDYGIRAGNGTIRNPTLARWFPTGAYDRSVDSFTVGYTDPWFAPGALASWLPDRTQSRSEAAYIEEHRDVYILHRRRVTTSLQWNVSPQVTWAVGYRWERTDVVPGVADISASDLEIYARYPPHTIVSAPFVQWVRDSRDNAFDPTRGVYTMARAEFANQVFLTSSNSSFIKVEAKNQWTWPVGRQARAGVVALGIHLGAVRPTDSSYQGLPLSERFFAGGPFSFRGVEPDALGIQAQVPRFDPTGQPIYTGGKDANGNPIQATYPTPVGGQGLVLANLEYRFPVTGKSVWGEVFVDSGQVYQSLKALSYQDRAQQARPGDPVPAARPPFRTALGLGLIFKIGIPLKIEYAADVKRIWGLPRSQDDRDTQLKSLLVSAGFQF
jgi:outer membrane protein assembly factor BamA